MHTGPAILEQCLYQSSPKTYRFRPWTATIRSKGTLRRAARRQAEFIRGPYDEREPQQKRHLVAIPVFGPECGQAATEPNPGPESRDRPKPRPPMLPMALQLQRIPHAELPDLTTARLRLHHGANGAAAPALPLQDAASQSSPQPQQDHNAPAEVLPEGQSIKQPPPKPPASLQDQGAPNCGIQPQATAATGPEQQQPQDLVQQHPPQKTQIPPRPGGHPIPDLDQYAKHMPIKGPPTGSATMPAEGPAASSARAPSPPPLPHYSPGTTQQEHDAAYQQAQDAANLAHQLAYQPSVQRVAKAFLDSQSEEQTPRWRRPEMLPRKPSPSFGNQSNCTLLEQTSHISGQCTKSPTAGTLPRTITSIHPSHMMSMRTLHGRHPMNKASQHMDRTMFQAKYISRGMGGHGSPARIP